GELSMVGRRLGLERYLVRAIDADQHRLQHSARATVDRNDLAGGRRRVQHAGAALVLEQRLSQFDPVADLDIHRRLEVDVIGTDDTDGSHRGRIVDALFRNTLDRQVESLSDLDARDINERATCYLGI